jgi:hypothetical protein
MKYQSKNTLFLILNCFLIFVISSCGPARRRDRENYGDLSAPGAILLNDPSKHSYGWGRTDCLVCHNVNLNVHRRAGSAANSEAINKAVMSGGESKFCLNCHGSNGID